MIISQAGSGRKEGIGGGVPAPMPAGTGKGANKKARKKPPSRAAGGDRTEREQTTVRLPKELAEVLKQEAKKLGIGFNALVLMILSEERIRHQTK